MHYCDVIMGAMASQITSLTIVYSIVYSGADQRKHQRSASLVFVRGIHRRPVNSPHKWPVTRKMFPFDDVIMVCADGILDVWCKPTFFCIEWNEAWVVLLPLPHWLHQGCYLKYIWLNLYQLIYPRIKWQPFSRRYFQMHFREWKNMYFD